MDGYRRGLSQKTSAARTPPPAWRRQRQRLAANKENFGWPNVRLILADSDTGFALKSSRLYLPAGLCRTSRRFCRAPSVQECGKCQSLRTSYFVNSPNLIELYMLSYRARNIRKSSLLVNAAQAESDAFCEIRRVVGLIRTRCATQKNPDEIVHRGHLCGESSQLEKEAAR